MQDIEAGGTGGKVVEHWYNAKTGAYSNIVFQVSPGPPSSRTLRAASRLRPLVFSRVKRRSTTRSSRSMNSSPRAWVCLRIRYFVGHGGVELPRQRDRHRKAGAGRARRRRQALRVHKLQASLRHHGRAKREARYIIKRDGCGQAERALALDPMPDFAFRQERWVCAPAASDAGGNLAINMHALKAGYCRTKAAAASSLPCGSVRQLCFTPRLLMTSRRTMDRRTCSSR